MSDDPYLGDQAACSQDLVAKISPVIRLLKRILTNFVDVENEATMSVLKVILEKSQIIAALSEIMRTMH